MENLGLCEPVSAGVPEEKKKDLTKSEFKRCLGQRPNSSTYKTQLNAPVQDLVLRSSGNLQH